MKIQVLLLVCLVLAVTGAPSSMFVYDSGQGPFVYQQNPISSRTSTGFYLPLASTETQQQQQQHFYVMQDSPSFFEKENNYFYADDFDSDDLYDYDKSSRSWHVDWDDLDDDKFYETSAYQVSANDYDTNNIYKRSLNVGVDDKNDHAYQAATFPIYTTTYDTGRDSGAKLFFKANYDFEDDVDSFENFESDEED